MIGRVHGQRTRLSPVGVLGVLCRVRQSFFGRKREGEGDSERRERTGEVKRLERT